MSNILNTGKNVLIDEANALIKASLSLNDSFIEAVNKIFCSKGHIVISGIGKSGLVGKKIAATFSSTGTPSFFVHPAEAIHGDLGMFVGVDSAILISNSGETDEILRILPILKRLKVFIISICGNINSTLSKLSNISIIASIENEACPLGLTPTTSTTVAMGLGDALAVSLLNLRKFNSSNYALFHPGGSLGRRLLLKVSDLMHTGESIPLVACDTSICEVVYNISKKRLGCVGVIDSKKSLIGIITDGDLRRALEQRLDIYSLIAKDLLLSIPKIIHENSLAVDALVAMQDNSITVLFVHDHHNNVVGVIHMHDLIKAKIY